MQQRQQKQHQNQADDGPSNEESIREYSLPEVLLQRIAELAPAIKETELRVLLHFAAHATPPEFTLRQSSRDIAKAIKQARSAVVRAIDLLTERKYITTRDGTGKKAAGYRLNIAHTIQMSGPFRGPLQPEQVVLQEDLVLFEDHSSGPFRGPLDPQAVPFEDHSTPASGPLRGPLPNKERAAARVDSDPISISDSIDRQKLFHSEPPIRTGNTAKDETIRRVLQAKPEDFTPAQLSDARRWIHGYQAKMRGDGPHPPDDKILARLLAALAPDWTPELLWRALKEDHTMPGEKYGWYVAVALQRAHGIEPKDFKQARDQFRLIKTSHAGAREKAELSPTADYPAEVLTAIAAAKGMP